MASVWLAALLAAVAHAQQLQLLNATSLPALSAGCVSALTAKVSCSMIETGVHMYQLVGNYTTDILNQMCTSACSKSLDDYRVKVLAACKNDVYNDTSSVVDYGVQSDPSGGAYSPIVVPDYIITNYKQRCLKANSGNYCFPYLSTTSSQDPCNECGLKMYQLELNNSYFYNDQLASDYSSLTSSCKVTTLAKVTPTSVVISSASATASSTCTGKVVTIPSGGTCDTVAAANNISTWQLLAANNLLGGCVKFPAAGTKLCITGSCKTYVATSKDSCLTVANSNNITITQLRTWNPNLNGACTNWQAVVGHRICLSNPGNYTDISNTRALSTIAPSTAAPVPTDVVKGTNTRCGTYYHVIPGDTCAQVANAHHISLNDFFFLNPELNTNCTNLFKNYSYCIQPVGDISTYPGYQVGGSSTKLSTATLPSISGTPTSLGSLPSGTIPSISITPTATYLYPLANGSRTDCEQYADNSYGNVVCDYLNPGVPIYNFVSWNPSLDYFNCMLRNKTRYCTLLGDDFLDQNGNASYNQYIDKPSNGAANSTDACYFWHTIASGDTCSNILSNYDITLFNFYKWNPTIKSDCTGLQSGVAYCVNSDEASGTGPPGPTQSGIAANCNKYYVVKSGDGCPAIATSYNITVAQFESWNPAVGSTCTNLQPNYAVCVGVNTTSTTTNPTSSTTKTSTTTTKPTTTTKSATTSCSKAPGPTQTGMPCQCKKFVQQTGSKYCYDLATDNNISLSQFYAWNPAVGKNCETMVGGDWYCVSA